MGHFCFQMITELPGLAAATPSAACSHYTDTLATLNNLHLHEQAVPSLAPHTLFSLPEPLFPWPLFTCVIPVVF